MATERTRKKIVDAFMALAETHRYDDITLTAVAERASVDLATLRGAYDSKLAMIEDFARRIDLAVLKDGDEDMGEEPARDRLFDVIMRRFDALAPYKSALKSLLRSARRDPVLAVSLNRISVVSQNWMLSAAGIETGGWLGLAKVQGLVIAYGRVFQVWLKDEDPGMARTMSALDRELRRGENLLQRLDGFLGMFPAPWRARERSEEAPKADASA